MFDETTQEDSGPTRWSPAGQLRLQLPQQSPPIRRGRRPEGYAGTSGAEASGLFGKWGQAVDDLWPF
ncbi:hypothetical protein ACFWUW_15735 [Streptomyces sp. NPDC058655]|uniref:hypothetical protein n=1 Tax=Streptomyces sp. NPDC058655 TaxID=3346577 RepID=UPI003652F8ED